MKERRLLCSFCLILLCLLVKGQDVVTISDTLDYAKISASHSRISNGIKHIDSRDLFATPAFLGTPDVIKVLQNISGVASGLELFSGLYVHGGDGNDNLFLLDGVPLFQVSHLAGLFSSFNSDTVESIDFYSSGFPACFGRKASSVVDVWSKDGSMKKLEGSFSIGLIDGRLHLGGPLIKNKLSFDIAVRRTWLDALLVPGLAIKNSQTPNSHLDGTYAFYDSNASLMWAASSRDKINVRFYVSSDKLKYEKNNVQKYYGKEIFNLNTQENLNLNWGNKAFSAAWRHSFNPSSSLSLLAYYSSGNSYIANGGINDTVVDETLVSEQYKETFTGMISMGGIELKQMLRKDCHNLTIGGDARIGDYSKYRTFESSLFAEDEIKLNILRLSTGLRLDTFSNDGYSKISLQPRLSACLDVTERMRLKASYEKMVQNSHLLSSIYLDLPSNIWVPSTVNVHLTESRQISTGLSFHASNECHFNMGAYYKRMTNCHIYANIGTIFPDIDRWEEDLISGIGRAYGIDTEIQHTIKNFQTSISYTLSWSERFFPHLHPTWFRDRFDNRHKLIIVEKWQITEKVDFNATWNFHSGNRISMPEHIVTTPSGEILYLYTEPYNVKLPDYHRLDIGCNIYSKTRRGHENIWNISIYNVYCRLNPIMARFSMDEYGKPVQVTYSLIPIIPSFSYTVKF